MINTPLASLGVSVHDLAPTEFRAIDFDWTGLSVRLIRSTADEHFDSAYNALWQEFGARNEMESRAVIAQRLQWRADQPIDGYAMQYDLVSVHGADGIAAVHDHTAVLNLRDPTAALIVHISHIFLAEPYRGSGLAGWMRTLPLRTAREVLRQTNVGPRAITLVAEMEPTDADLFDRLRRLRSYEKGGYLKVDPTAIDYAQPDFRDPAVIDATGGPRPVRLSLVIRRVGKENEHAMTGRHTRALVESLYHIYRQSIRPQDMRPNDENLRRSPSNDAQVALLPPTQVAGKNEV